MLALLFLAPLLAGQSTATEPLNTLQKRDDDNNNSSAFVPRVTPGCPKDWPVCGSSGVCYNPAEGQICCPGGTYACPSSSFCLADGYCCPNSLSPDACAQKYGLSLILTPTSQSPSQTESPVDSDTDDVNESASDAYSDEDSTSDPPYPYPRPTIRFSSASSVTITSTPIPTSSIAPWPSIVPTTGSPSAIEEPAFTGAGVGVRETVRGKGVMGVVAVAIAMLGV